jgi:hypothetical protein
MALISALLSPETNRSAVDTMRTIRRSPASAATA